MKELYELRVLEKHAHLLFKPDEGKKLGWTKQFGDKFVTVRQVKLTPDNPKFKRIGELNAEIKKKAGDFFFAGWSIRRRYTAEELQRAELFHLCRLATFEPAGEECGTKYDESLACPVCKSGAKQTTPLFLDWRRIPKKKILPERSLVKLWCPGGWWSFLNGIR